MHTTSFTKESRIDAPVRNVFQWHARPGALERLSPPWDPLEVIEHSGGIQKGATVLLKMKAGPIPYRWAAEHTQYQTDRLFQDQQKRGPFAYWQHTHTFEPDANESCRMQDRIDYALPVDPLSRPFLPVINQKLERIFNYRHTTLAHDLALHHARPSKQSLKIVVSGASGVLGQAIIPFFTTGGHQVKRLVRRQSASSHDLLWNPYAGELEPAGLKDTDVVINLSGESIGEGRWTKAKKRRIIQSRINTTTLIAETVAQLDPPPKVLLNASAIGFYGDQGDACVAEDSCCGADFISEVCDDWEKAAAPALKKGIRVVFLRIGVVLTPRGGALRKMLLPFRMGLGGPFGSGQQYVSFIGVDDVIGAVHHIINDDSLEGPVNLVAPQPVTNQEFARTLGEVLKRPSALPAPSFVIKALFGQMGREIVLSGARVEPDKLTASGYRFRNPDLEGVLRHVLGLEC